MKEDGLIFVVGRLKKLSGVVILVDKRLLSDKRTIFSRSLENEPKVRNRAIVFQVMAGQGCPSLEGEIR